MLARPTPRESLNNLRALANYRKPYRRIDVPAFRMHRDTLLNHAAMPLFPWEHTGEYPGRIKGLLALFQNRVAYVTIRNWRRGTRRTPQWALDVMATELRSRIAALQ